MRIESQQQGSTPKTLQRAAPGMSSFSDILETEGPNSRAMAQPLSSFAAAGLFRSTGTASVNGDDHPVPRFDNMGAGSGELKNNIAAELVKKLNALLNPGENSVVDADSHLCLVSMRIDVPEFVNSRFGQPSCAFLSDTMLFEWCDVEAMSVPRLPRNTPKLVGTGSKGNHIFVDDSNRVLMSFGMSDAGRQELSKLRGQIEELCIQFGVTLVEFMINGKAVSRVTEKRGGE